MIVRKVNGAVDRLSIAFVPDEIELVAELVTQTGAVLGRAHVEENGQFSMQVKEPTQKPIPTELLFLQVRPDVDEPTIEPFRLPVKPEAIKDGMLDLTKEPLMIPKKLRVLWGPFFEVCCARGRVVACPSGTPAPLSTCCAVRGAKVQAYVYTWAPWGLHRKVLATTYTDENGFFRLCTWRFKIPKVIVPVDPSFDWHDLIRVEPRFPIPLPEPPWPGPDPAPYEGILHAWQLERSITAEAPAVPEVMPRLAALESLRTPQVLPAAERVVAKAAIPAAAVKEAMLNKAVPSRPDLAVQKVSLTPIRDKVATLPPLVIHPCSAGWHFRVTQEVDTATQVIYDDGFFPQPHSIWPFGFITLYANSAAVCGATGPAPTGKPAEGFIFTGVGNIGRDLIDGWADTTSLFAVSPPANVPLVKDAAFAGALSIYGVFADGLTHYKVEYARRSGDLRSGGPDGPWVTYDEPFSFATQFLNTDPSSVDYHKVRTLTVHSVPVATGEGPLFVLPDQLIQAASPGPGWTWLETMQPVVLGLNTANLLPGGAGYFTFRLTPYRIVGATATFQPADTIRLVIDNTPVNFGVTTLQNEDGVSILNSACPKVTLHDATDALFSAFKVVDENGHLASLAVNLRVGNASTQGIIPAMSYLNTGDLFAAPTANYVGTFAHVPAGGVAVAVADPSVVAVTANFPQVDWPNNYWRGGTGTFRAPTSFWTSLVADVASGGCPFAIEVYAQKRTTNGFAMPGATGAIWLFLVRTV